MATKSNIPAQKKVVSVEILHLDELGYGPKGLHSRREWRKECIENLLAGKQVFEAWQNSWFNDIDINLSPVYFKILLNETDKTEPRALSLFGNTFSLDFSGQIFEDLYSFKKIIFKHEVFFAGANFRCNANFENAEFNKSVDFRYSNFNGNLLSFSKTIFHSFANFEGSVFLNFFLEYLSFEKAKFRDFVSFEKINFVLNVNFKNTSFDKGVNFKNTKFERGCNFEEVIFGSKDISYPSSTNFMPIDFTDAEFIADAKFNNSTFNLASYFIKCKFFGDAEFKNTNFHEDVRFFDVKFYGGTFFNDSTFTGNAVKRLGQMKRLAEDNGQTDQALNFNALELDVKIKQVDASRLFKVITWAYKNLADYGRSFAKPIFLYAVLICLSALFAMAYSTYSESPVKDKRILCNSTNEQPLLKLDYGRAVVEYAMFRAGGLMDFTDTGKQNNAVNCRLFEEPIEPPLMRAWGIFKGIASIALLFLAALGLRNKYRIK